MAGPILHSCCRCLSLRMGSIVTGVGTILSLIVSLIILFTIELPHKSIFLKWLSPETLKAIIAFGTCMTILISIVMIVGAIKQNHYLLMLWVLVVIKLVISVFITVICTSVVFIVDNNCFIGIAILVFGLPYAALAAYLWTVVYSYFTILREDSKREKHNKEAYMLNDPTFRQP